MVQWLRVCLSTQETQVGSLIWDDPTCLSATKPVCHNYRTCALEPRNCDYWTHVQQLLNPMCLEPGSTAKEATAMRSQHIVKKSSPCSLHLEKALEATKTQHSHKKTKTENLSTVIIGALWIIAKIIIINLLYVGPEVCVMPWEEKVIKTWRRYFPVNHYTDCIALSKHDILDYSKTWHWRVNRLRIKLKKKKKKKTESSVCQIWAVHKPSRVCC